MAEIKYDSEQVASVFEAHKNESAIVITSDGNVFLEKHESYAKSHCREFKQTFKTLTRAEFEANEKGGKSKTLVASGSGSNPPVTPDWKTLKFGDIVEFAKSKGLTPVTLKTKGTKALIVEVETYLASLPKEKPEVKNDEKEGQDPEGEKKGGEDLDDDYNPVGTGTDSNPQA